MATVFFFGHGGWDPRGSESGFTPIPKGTTFRFYTQANSLMTLGFGLKLIAGDPSCGEPDQEFREYQQCPDMTLYPAPEFHGHVVRAAQTSGANVVVANAPVKLSSVLRSHAGSDIVWIACRALELQSTPQGRAAGINRVGR
jgi:hypothetical protein